MDRRSTIATLLGRTKNTQSQAKQRFKLNTSLNPYEGPWEFDEAAHLLRRTTFGPTYDQIKWATEQGLEAVVEKLFEEGPLPEPPVNYGEADDPYVPIGSTWVEAPYSPSINLRGYRNRSLRAWTFSLMFTDPISIREKLTLFWHNHFAVGNINDPRFFYRHISLCRSYAWGNFRDLIKDITVDPAMLRFLNGNQNTKNAPNENFARELLELYTIGKGPLAGQGDYTNYTEEDVIQIARILTGWKDQGFNSTNPDVSMGSYFRANKHDVGEKQLSHRFDNVVISDQGELEYLELIDIIFQKMEVARFISRKLYRWFVYYQIDDATEMNIIEPMAQMLVDNDYNLKPVLVALFQSEHFFGQKIRGAMIKNPIDFVVSSIKPFNYKFPDDLEKRYLIWNKIHQLTKAMDMFYYAPPDVAGWKAFYQEPTFYRVWINASTLQARMAFTDKMSGNGYGVSGERLKLDLLSFIASLDNPMDVNSVIEELSKILHPEPLTENQKKSLKEILIPGLPDFEWTLEYSEYLADSENNALRNSMEDKLQDLIRMMISMGEFYLS